MRLLQILVVVFVVVLMPVSTATALIGEPPTKQCADSVDNDGDGLIDHPADPGCQEPQ